MSVLPIPDAITQDTHAKEILRIWASGGEQHVSLVADIWADPASWGIMLVDLAKHIANAYAQAEGKNSSTVLNRIKAGFDAEWSSATDVPTGDIG